MAKDYLTHDELQHIEHANKVLREHEEIATRVVVGVKSAMEEYIVTVKLVTMDLVTAQVELIRANAEVVKSIREVKLVTSNINELINYGKAIADLNNVLNSGIIDKVLRLRDDKS